MAPGHLGRPGGDAGWALRRALRCDAAAGASDTAAELLADAASRVPVDGTESAELRRVAALASTFAAAARDAPPPDPRATRRETFPVASPSPGFGTRGFARELDAEYRASSASSHKGTSRQKTKTKTKPKPTFEKPILEPVWSASLASFLDASPRRRLALALADGARDFELTEPALASAAACALVREPAGTGGDALRAWLVSLVASERFDVAAVALRWVSGGPGAGHGAGDLGADQNDADQNGVFESSKQPSRESNDRDTRDPRQKLRERSGGRALGGAEGAAAAALEAARACPAGDDRGDARAAALDAMAPSAKIADWSRARAAAAAARVFASRNVDVTTREVLEAAETETSRVSSASPNEATNETARDAEKAENAENADKAEHSNVHALELCVASPRRRFARLRRERVPARRPWRVVAPTLGRPRGARRRRPGGRGVKGRRRRRISTRAAEVRQRRRLSRFRAARARRALRNRSRV